MSKKARVAEPTSVKMRINKRFFVEMLTRDIELEDAILDLLDNSIDGVIRSSSRSTSTSKAFRGYWSKITLSADGFSIVDNCGGIPKRLIERAFGIGRDIDPNEHYKTIGIYGIGMKRAIFKIALEASVQSHSDFGFEVSISEKWLRDEDEWRLDYSRKSVGFKDGTKVEAKKLRPEISRMFATKAFVTKLGTFISQHYAVILNKGFKVYVNGVSIEPAPLGLLATSAAADSEAESVVAPYMVRYETPDVRAALWVGLYRTPPESDSDEESETEQRQTRDNSGWTIICNDRAIVSNDTTILTGWGEAGVPRFHPQFIGIRGILTLESEKPLELPLTTTKRGLDASSALYLNLKQFMREGTKVFTNFTNHWKSDRAKAKRLFRDAELRSLPELKKLMGEVTLSAVRRFEGAERFSPKLPTPEPSDLRRVSFVRHKDDISKVGKLLLEDPKAKPTDVGSACFDDAMKRVSQ